MSAAEEEGVVYVPRVALVTGQLHRARNAVGLAAQHVPRSNVEAQRQIADALERIRGALALLERTDVVLKPSPEASGDDETDRAVGS